MSRITMPFGLLCLILIASLPLVCFTTPTITLGPDNKDVKKDHLPQNCSHRDLRGAIIDISAYRDRDVVGFNFNGSNLEGCYFNDEARFIDCTFHQAILRGVFIDSLLDSHYAENIHQSEIYNLWEKPPRYTDYTKPELLSCCLKNADISFSDIHVGVPGGRSDKEDTTCSWLLETKNYKEKNLSNTNLRKVGADFSHFNLQGTYFIGTQMGAVFADADITRGIFQGELLFPEGMYSTSAIGLRSLTLEQLYATKNYKEKNLGTVIFVYADLKNANLRGQTLGYFDACNLEGADLSDAFFSVRDKRTLPPFVQNNPIGLTDCLITVEQFKQTRNYKIWKERGIPEIKQIVLTEQNAPDYNYGRCVEGVSNLNERKRVAEYFGNRNHNVPLDTKGDVAEKYTLYLYQVGDIFITKEIADALREEKASKNDFVGIVGSTK
ncbi:MAG: pentapeptide repeat-containing protein [Thermoguttaceae bacterium]